MELLESKRLDQRRRGELTRYVARVQALVRSELAHVDASVDWYTRERLLGVPGSPHEWGVRVMVRRIGDDDSSVPKHEFAQFEFRLIGTDDTTRPPSSCELLYSVQSIGRGSFGNVPAGRAGTPRHAARRIVDVVFREVGRIEDVYVDRAVTEHRRLITFVRETWRDLTSLEDGF